MLCGAAWLVSSMIILLLPKDFDRDISPSRHRRIALLFVFVEFMGAYWLYLHLGGGVSISGEGAAKVAAGLKGFGAMIFTILFQLAVSIIAIPIGYWGKYRLKLNLPMF